MKKSNLEKLYDRATGYVAEAKRLAELEKTKRQEEAKALKEGSLENEETFNLVARIRMMRDMIPGKIRQLEELSETAWGEVKTEFATCCRVVLEDVERRLTAEESRIVQLLLPACADEAEAKNVANRILDDQDYLPSGVRLLRDERNLIASSLNDFSFSEKISIPDFIQKYSHLLGGKN